MTLKDLTQRAALSFLSTVLVVDELIEQRGEPVKALKPPPGLMSPETSSENGQQQVEQEVGIRSGPLVDAFSELGLFATPFVPEEISEEEFVSQIEPLALRADIVVLDWNIYGDDGRRSLALAKRLVEDDQGQRVRILVFYTGHELEHVRNKLVEELELPQFEQGRSKKGPLRVVVLGKADSTVGKQDDPKASEAELPRRLVDIFTTEYAGMLPTAVLTGLAAVREQAHNILARFPGSLDAAFLGHRILLDQPREAGDQIPFLIGDEIASVLSSVAMDSAMTFEHVQEWIRDRSDLYPEDDPDTLENLIAMHRGEWDNIAGEFKRRVNDAPALVHDPQADPTSDEKWAEIAATTQLYSGRTPVLALGSIVCRSTDPPEYWLCLQPLCDAVRITENTRFPFLPLKPTDDRFEIVVRNIDEMVRLQVVHDANKVMHYKFAPSTNLVVEAKKRQGRFSFESTGLARFWWLGNLKPAAAQRVVHRFASKVSRVGLDESEWLRRKAGDRPKRR